MISKIIHYCWFGRNPLPELAQRCIASWRKFLPDYEIWQWSEWPLNENETLRYENEKRCELLDRVMSFDVNIIPYTAEAYKQKKYAFVSDYARFWILYQYGGIYFDTDVEVIRPLDDIIERGNFMGFEVDPDGENTPRRYAPKYCFGVALGLGFGISKGHQFMKKMMEHYGQLHYDNSNLNPWYKTIVAYTTEILMEDGLENKKGIQKVGDIYVYPHDFFAPINVITGKLKLSPNTRTIHHYMGSWNKENENVNENENKKISLGYLKKRLRNSLPEWVFYLNNKIKRRKYRIK